MLRMQRALRKTEVRLFRTYDWDVEMKYTVRAKEERFGWGLLRAKLEPK